MAHKVSEHGGFVVEGTISHGTLRPQDLLRAFAGEYERLSPFSARSMVRDAYEFADILDKEDESSDQYHDVMNGIGENLDELHDAINELVAPLGFYFGATIGDGSDIGIWQVETEEQEDINMETTLITEGLLQVDPSKGILHAMGQELQRISFVNRADRYLADLAMDQELMAESKSFEEDTMLAVQERLDQIAGEYGFVFGEADGYLEYGFWPVALWDEICAKAAKAP